MKTILLTFSFLLGLSSNSLTQTLDNPIVYFDYFNKQHAIIVQQNMGYLRVMVHSEDLRQITRTRLDLLQQIEQIEQQLKQLPAYDKDAGLKTAMQGILSTYQRLYQGAYPAIETLKPTARQSFELMQNYINHQNAAEKELANASRQFLEAQRRFAAANHIVLMETQGASQTEQLNKLNEYQRQLFLSSFRVSKLNAQFLEALETPDRDALNSALNLLLDACREEIDKVEKTSDFNDNIAYRNAVLEREKAIYALAKEDYTILIKGAVTPNALDAEEMEHYNKVAQKINTTLNPFMEKINNSLQDLLRENVPRPAHKGVKEI